MQWPNGIVSSSIKAQGLMVMVIVMVKYPPTRCAQWNVGLLFIKSKSKWFITLNDCRVKDGSAKSTKNGVLWCSCHQHGIVFMELYEVVCNVLSVYMFYCMVSSPWYSFNNNNSNDLTKTLTTHLSFHNFCSFSFIFIG